MFSHIMLGAKNIEESKRFYDAVLGELGVEPIFLLPYLSVTYADVVARFRVKM